jgi:hypothetical protein
MLQKFSRRGATAVRNARVTEKSCEEVYEKLYATSPETKLIYSDYCSVHRSPLFAPLVDGFITLLKSALYKANEQFTPLTKYWRSQSDLKTARLLERMFGAIKDTLLAIEDHLIFLRRDLGHEKLVDQSCKGSPHFETC